MAYRRASSRRRTYSSRRTTARSSRRRTTSRRRTSRGVTAQTLRIVFEQIPVSNVSRAVGPMVQAEAKKRSKAKY